MLSNEQKTISVLSSLSDGTLQQIITREWIDGSNIETCGEAFLSSQEKDIVHLDFAEELYSAVLDTATETWRLLSARRLVSRREVRAFKENLGRLYLWGRDFQEGRLATVLRQSDDLRDAVLDILSHIGGLVIRIILSDSSNSTLHQQVASLQLLIEKSRLIITSADSECVDEGGNTDSESETSSICSEDRLPSTTAGLQCDVDCLMDLVPTMEQTLSHLDAAAQRNHSSHGVVFAVSEAARPWVSNVSDKFDKADTKLVERLGESNWQRYLTVRARMNQIASAPKDILAPHFEKIQVQAVFKESPQSMFRPLSMFHDSGLGSSIPSAPAPSHYAQSVASHTSFITSLVEAEDSSRRVPPTPAEVGSGKPFRCEICGHQLFNIKNRIDWKIHVFADLQPYICTFQSCEKELLKFPTRKLWSQHEFTEHRVDRSWNCPECQQSFLSCPDLKEHLGNQHKDAIHSTQLSSILHAAEVRTEQPVDNQECPLCKIKPGRSRRYFVTHVGRHMESIALAVLPHDPGGDSDDESVTSTSDSVNLVDGGEPYLYVSPSCGRDTSRSGYTWEPEILTGKLFHENRRLGTAYTLLFGPGNALVLAQHYVDKNRDRFPGGIFWIDGGSGEGLNHEWERMARQLMKIPAMTATSNLQMKELRFWFESRHDWVIIFNGMKGFNEIDQYSFRNFLPKSPESSIIFVMGENDDLSHDTKRTLQRHGISHPPWNEYARGISKALCLRYGTSFDNIDSLKEHMVAHYEERPEKCPMVGCAYYWKGFARKYDKDRHILTHFDKPITCNFCPPQLDGIVPIFNRVDVFKRHLSVTHTVDRSRVPPEPDSNTGSLSQGAKCSVCTIQFVGPQALYDHLQECIYDVLLKDPNYNPQVTDLQRWSSERSMLTGRPDASPEKEVTAPPLARLEQPSSLDVALKTASHAGFVESSNTLLVDNIPRETNEQVLQRLFRPYGEIESIHIPGNDATGLHKGFAYVCFSTREAAVTAFERVQGDHFNNHRLRIRYVQGVLPSEEVHELRDKMTGEKQIQLSPPATLPRSNEPPNVRDLANAEIRESRKVLKTIHEETLDPYSYSEFAASDSAQSLFGGGSFPTWMGNTELQPPDVEKEMLSALLANTSGETSKIQTQESLLSQTYESRQYTSPRTDMLLPGVNELPNMLLPPISDQLNTPWPLLPPLRSRLLADPDCVSPGDSVIAVSDYNSTDSTTLDLRKGDRIEVVGKMINGWWDGILHGQRGWFPSNYCDVDDRSYYKIVDGLSTTGDSAVDTGITRNEKSLVPTNFSNHKEYRQGLASEGRKPYLHESRDKHAMRSRGLAQSFLTKEETAISWAQACTAHVRKALDDLPFKCPFHGMPHPCSPSSGFASRVDLRTHVSIVHSLNSDGIERVLDSALPCTITGCVRSLSLQGFASSEEFQRHYSSAHIGILRDVEKAASGRLYTCKTCAPTRSFQAKIFSAEEVLNHLVSAHRMAENSETRMPPPSLDASNQTQADFEVQAESEKGKAEEHAQTPTSSQAPFEIPLKSTVKLPAVWKP